MNYGMKDKNPIDEMYFYSKSDMNTAKKIPKDQVRSNDIKTFNLSLSLHELFVPCVFYIKATSVVIILTIAILVRCPIFS